MKRESSAIVAKKIIDLLLTYRRIPDTACQHKDCFVLHRDKIQSQLMADQPIEFVLPAFPAKSPNINKTAGPLPDLGERLALNFLEEVCKEIKSFYIPGAKVIICSDGRVFNDLVKVKDEDVNAYAQEIKHIIQRYTFNHINTFSLDDYYPEMSYIRMRSRLVDQYGEPLSHLKNKVKNNDTEKLLFNGIHRFIYEDHLSLLRDTSKNQIRNLTKAVAYKVIQRSNAWSRLVQKRFPKAVRLSIHPQLCGSEKFGIMLVKSKDVWATPWHRVVLQNGNDSILIRKKEAEELGARPVFRNNQFSHYVMRGTSL